MPHILPRLPYAYDALEPYISASMLQLHHGTHHRAYLDQVSNLEDLRASVREVAFRERTLEEIIFDTAGKQCFQQLFNNAAQAWNHAFYWHSLTPNGGGVPTGEIGKWIDREFGSYDTLATELAAAAAGQFGSGWAWVVLESDRLKITATSNAETPLILGQIPLLAIDVWEHAYYLDYQNRRSEYAAAIIEHLLNWDFANRNLIDRDMATGTCGPLAGPGDGSAQWMHQSKDMTHAA